MQMAIDRAQIKSQILHGLGDIPNSVLMGLKYDAPLSQIKPYPYDVNRAKQLMAKSKFPHGFSTTLQYPSGYDYYNQLALLLQQEFSQIGIKVKLVQEDPGTGTSKFLAMKYDMTFPFASFTSDVIVPDEYANFLADPSNGLNGFFSHWSDPAIQKMVQQFEATTDEAARAQLWPKIQRALYEQTPVIDVMKIPFVNAHTSNTCGTAIDALGSDHLEDTWLASK
jgi:peptide/nickel transport system substrate-binding protein